MYEILENHLILQSGSSFPITLEGFHSIEWIVGFGFCLKDIRLNNHVGTRFQPRERKIRWL